MPKRKYLISVLILVIYILFCCKVTNHIPEITNISTSDIMLKSSKPKEIPIARIQINRLDIDHYIYNINSENNNVEKNVTLLKESILPNQNHSIIFLAAHSGNSKISYFNNLGKIKLKEYVNFYYNDYKYIYEVTDIHEESKNGYIGINKRKEDQLILTTCSTQNNKKQLIVESTLIKKEKYHKL